MAELDLRTAVRDLVEHPGSLSRAMCVVHPDDARADVCERIGEHPADAFMRLACGCTFSYCLKSLRNIYGHTLLSYAICPRHNASVQIIQADWIRA